MSENVVENQPAPEPLRDGLVYRLEITGEAEVIRGEPSTEAQE